MSTYERHGPTRLISALLSLTVACGGAVSGGSEGSGSGNPSPATPTPSAPTNALGVSLTDVVVVYRYELGRMVACGEDYPSESVRIDFSTERLTRGGARWVCAADAGEASGKRVDVVDAEIPLTQAQAASLLALASAVTVTRVDKCLGFDGESYSISVQHPDGTVESHTDGISFGCDVVASGQDSVYTAARRLFPND